MSFEDIFCQDRAISILCRAFSSDKAAHAYVFAHFFYQRIVGFFSLVNVGLNYNENDVTLLQESDKGSVRLVTNDSQQTTNKRPSI